MNELFLLFFTVAVTEFFAEMGDKTQLLLIGMTSKYKIRDIILGTAAAILVLNGIAVLAGGLVSSFVPDWLIKFIAAAAFLYFAVTTIHFGGDDDEEENAVSKFKFAPVAVFSSFFVAELGDKTQLTAITFGANGGMSALVIVWLACSVGLFAADIIGMLIGLFLKKNAPKWILDAVAFVLFGFFGFKTVWEGLGLLQEKYAAAVVPVCLVMTAVAVVFAALCVMMVLLGKKKTAEK